MHIASYMTLTNMRDDDLAEKVGVSRVTISRVRRGICSPSLRLAARIADATQGAVTPNDFALTARPPAREREVA